MKQLRIACASVLVLMYAGVAVQVAPAPVKNADHVNTSPFFAGISDAGSFRAATDARLAEVQQRAARPSPP